MNRFTLHVPEQGNDGTPVDAQYLDGFVERELVNIGGGFTLTSAIGAWRGEDTIYRESIRLYAIDSADPTIGAQLLKLARTIAADLDQEAVYVTAQPIATKLVTREAVIV